MQKRLALLLALIGAVLFGAASAHAAPILSTPDGKAILFGAVQPPAVAIDFTKGSYAEKGVSYGSLSALPGWSFSRASTGYAQKSDGTLVSFATGVPRITDLGLLVEQASTNLALQSQNLASATWTQDNTTASTSGNAPDGTATAQVLNEGTATGAHFAYQTITVTSGQQVSVSEYVNTCTTTRRYVQVGMSSSTPAGGVWATFDTQGLTLTEATASGAGVYTSSTKAQLGSGCWWRIAVTGSITGATTYYIAPELASTATPGGFGFTGQSYTGASLVGVFWGIQAETLIAPTSYIPTTTSSAPRAADQATLSGITVGSSGAATVGFIAPSIAQAYRLLGNNANSADILDATTAATTNRVATWNGSVQLQTPAVSGGFGATVKGGVSWSPTGRVVAINGGSLVSDSNSLNRQPITLIELGYGNGSSTVLNSYIQSVTLYPQAKTPAQLQALTH